MSQPTDDQPLAGRLALVTGASRGIGRAAAIALAKAGADLILVARTVGGLEEVDDEVQKLGRSATLVPLDLKEFDAIDQLGAQIFERWGKLDIAVGNAGTLGVLTPITHLQPKDYQAVIDINVTANWRLIRSLHPLLKVSDAGRAIYVTSGAAQAHRPFWGPYALSKAALETLVLTYAQECAKTPIKVSLVNPGATRTAMRAKAMPGEDPQTLPHPDEIAPLFVELASPQSTVHGEVVKAADWLAKGRAH